MSRLASLLLVSSFPWFLAACGGEDGSGGALDEPQGGEAAASTATAPASPEPATPSRWPRPIPPEPYQLVEVEGAGSLRGTVTTDREGRPVEYETAAGAACPDGLDPDPRKVAAGPLPGAVIRVAGIAGGAAVVARDAEVSLELCEFKPAVQLATVGSAAKLRATDGAGHTVRLIQFEGYRDLGAVALADDGAEASKRLRTPGLIHLRCEDHPRARGWIWVADHPYHALTGTDGSFVIEGLPAGKHQVAVWHEAFGDKVVEVEVPASGEALLDVHFP